ncbi:hypothetical protein KAU45_00535 [bacterium]|nr:hypothetical protein [bacterium]
MGLVGDLTPELEASILETAREAIEVGGGSFIGEIELSGGSPGYGLPATTPTTSCVSPSPTIRS